MSTHVETHLGPRGMPPVGRGLMIGTYEPGDIVQLRAVVVRHDLEDSTVEVVILGDDYESVVAWLPGRAEVTR